MKIHFHPYAQERMGERGATEHEVRTTVEMGERFPAKFGRVGFRRNFPYDRLWRGRRTRPSKLKSTRKKNNRRNGL